MKNSELRFIRELFLEEFPFKTRSEKNQFNKDILHIMNNNSADYLGQMASLQGGNPDDFHLLNCGWYEHPQSSEPLYLLNYCFTDYHSMLWASRGNHWPSLASAFEDMSKLRSNVLSWLTVIDQLINHSKGKTTVSDLLGSIRKSKLSKLELYSLLEIEELLSKSDFNKSYPCGAIHYHLINSLETIVDYNTKRSDQIFDLICSLGLTRIKYDQHFSPNLLTEEELDNFILQHEDAFALNEVSQSIEQYSKYIQSYEEAYNRLSIEFFEKTSKFLNCEDFNYQDQIEMNCEDWIILSKNFLYKSDLHLLKINGEIISIKEKSIEPLRLLIQQCKRQESADYLVTKEELLSASKYKPENIREFKVGKSLFPKEPLKSLVQYDKHRGGYLLAV